MLPMATRCHARLPATLAAQRRARQQATLKSSLGSNAANATRTLPPATSKEPSRMLVVVVTVMPGPPKAAGLVQDADGEDDPDDCNDHTCPCSPLALLDAGVSHAAGVVQDADGGDVHDDCTDHDCSCCTPTASELDGATDADATNQRLRCGQRMRGWRPPHALFVSKSLQLHRCCRCREHGSAHWFWLWHELYCEQSATPPGRVDAIRSSGTGGLGGGASPRLMPGYRHS